MNSMHPHHCVGKQRGAALMVMLVIIVVGGAALLLSALNSSKVKLSRQDATSTALAQAKEALIGRAVKDPELPGSLPCPDINDDGSAESTVSPTPGNCPSYIGRLPWKSLGLPDLRDGSGERLWYVLSSSFRDYIASNPINSDTTGNLTINGNTSANNVVAIIFSAGNVLSGQSRSSTQTALCATTSTTVTENLCATNYLEGGNGNLNTLANPNLAFQTNPSSDQFNDQIIHITHTQLFTPVEMRIAREVKKCLDDYALADGDKYPWASPDLTYTGVYAIQFGWIPAVPNTATSAGGSSYSTPAAQTLADALNALQGALDAYNANPTATNKTALNNISSIVIGLKNSVAGVSSSTIDRAGDYGIFFANGARTYSEATTKNNDAFSALNTAYPPTAASADASMPNTSWNTIASCNTLLNSSAYWANWKQSVFFKVANGYQPGSSASCNPGSTCLTVNGSGNTTAGNHNDYRATVIVARHAISQTRPSANTADYLEGNNFTQAIPNTFETYKSSDASYSTINDLVLCLDGKVNCK